jgi:putative ABC transport system permease protein
MNIKDLLTEIYISISGNKVRSGLTMLGIVIGIGSVIALISIGQGAQQSISASIQSIGSNLIIVTPGTQRSFGGQVSGGRGTAQTLTLDDVQAVSAQVANVKAVAPDVTKRYQVTAKGKNTNTQIIGTTADYAVARNTEVESGSFITDAHNRTMSKIAVIGPTTRDDLFGVDVDPIGQTIRINNVTFTIVGVLKAKGGSGFSNQDDKIIIPLTVMTRFFSGNEYVNTISISASSEGDMVQIQNDVTELLLKRHKINNPQAADFSVLNQSDIVATATSVTGTFTVFLGAVAGISLVVGGIGIMNMMLTTVTERTREIGLRKAIGAKNRDISMQFLLEAIVITFVGGFFGVLLGLLVSFVVSSVANIATTVAFSSIMLSFGVSALIGIVFGYYPARRASLLNPIEALRHE